MSEDDRTYSIDRVKACRRELSNIPDEELPPELKEYLDEADNNLASLLRGLQDLGR